MGTHRALRAARVIVGAIGFALLYCCGCQVGTAPVLKLVEQRQKIDDTGLADPVVVDSLKVVASLPNGWVQLKPQTSLFYTHQQWRSPTRRTAVGVTHARLPLPLSAKAVAWLAMEEAVKKGKSGRIIRQWDDELGRHWFEVENRDYHVTGYLMTRGLDAWLNYWGYRIKEPKLDAEAALAARSLDTLLPKAAASEKLAAK